MMRRIAFPAVMAALLSAAGCATRAVARAELFATGTFAVTPENGVWDDEYGRTSDPDDCSFTFRVIRYDDGIGVTAAVIDDRVTTDDCEPGSVSCPGWDDDNVECFFDGDHDGSKDSRSGHGLEYGGEFTLVANGAAQSDFSGQPRGFGRTWKGTASVSPRPEGGFRIDYRLWFSWECIGRRTPPRPDEDVTFGFNICVHDDDDGGRNDRALYWTGNPALPYRDESAFGTVTLKGAAGEARP